MQVKPVDEMTNQEFEDFLTHVQEAELDQLSFPTFMDMLWALQAERAIEVVEISAKLVDGNLYLETSSNIPIRGNELILGNKHLVIKWAGA
jgi:hypothetical protein